MKKQLKNFLKNYKEKVRVIADELSNEKIPVLTEELFSLYETTGNRLKYEDVYFKRRKYLAVYGFLSIIDRRHEDIANLEDVLTDICSEECWALPAHVNRRDNSDWFLTVDLFAAETAQALSEIISILNEELSLNVKELVSLNVKRRVLEPFYNSKAPYDTWEYSTHNWCAVCAGSIGSASIYLMRDQPEYLNQCLKRICNSLVYYVKGFSEDGACMEGLSYYTYGMTYFVGFAAQAYEYSKGAIDFLFINSFTEKNYSKEKELQIRKYRNMTKFQQKCYFNSGRTISFSDGDSRDRFKVGLTSYLAMNFPGVNLPNLKCAAMFDTDTCFRWMAVYRDYIWTLNYTNMLKNEELKTDLNPISGQIVLPYAEWSICQGNHEIGMAAKGGHNNEPHNHNDVGSFLYLIGEDMLLSDLGAGEYTKTYFSELRYEILCNSSFGHNVPIINGQGQLAGENYVCDKFETDGKGKTVISFVNAYQAGSLSSLVRSLYFDKESGILQVEDCFDLSSDTISLKENLITQGSPRIFGNQIIIYGGKNACRIEIEDKDVLIACIKKLHNNHIGETEEVYLLQWEIPFIPVSNEDVLVKQRRVYSRFCIVPE